MPEQTEERYHYFWRELPEVLEAHGLDAPEVIYALDRTWGLAAWATLRLGVANTHGRGATPEEYQIGVEGVDSILAEVAKGRGCSVEELKAREIEEARR